ncbi:Lsr2 family protein [Corynebacterium diphtheriae]|nr:Lsr2 family protein [Corynebacterium diphtheriae]CAB0710654.1 Lsr2 family protein [Corynebacterium diphtheriae]CAB0976457.1 Lsr2 family protein [Corynebacterium diphtheriae]
MARREITQYFDDIDNTPLTEDQVHVVRFGVNGINYVLDLSADNAQKFEDALAPFVEKAHRAKVDESAHYDPKTVRAWAQKHDYQVADRGKIPSTVIEAFLKSTKR